MSAGMSPFTSVEALAQVLALVGLVIATQLYFLLIRRRRARAEDAARRDLERSRARSVARFRRLRRRDPVIGGRDGDDA
jgi:flagellar biosynthesis/type III secretory pathway M-ring protein FliF/YscJ